MDYRNFLLRMAAVVATSFGVSFAQVDVSEVGGWFETAYAEWSPLSDATAYNVYADGDKVDAALIRSYGSYMRVDVPGLKAGSHTLKIAPVVNGSEGAAIARTVDVMAHDRSGFAFSNGRVPGAYNMDGTLKSGSVVVYVTEKSKNTVTADVVVDSKGTKKSCKSFQGILNCMKKGYETRPFDFRFIGEVTDSDSLVGGDMLIDLGKSEKSYVTVEGIGEDATVNGWGIRLKNAQNVEVRNVGIMNVNSTEGDNIGLQQDNQYVWIHNNDFFYGHAGSDKDQVKGDGALDCKKSTYITFSYNHFFDNGKSNLLGLSEGTTEGLYITYHHNWYDHSDSRHPRVRYYSAHVYNNYYDGNAKYGIGATLGSSIFAEGNYFRNCKYPMLTSMQGSDVYAGSAKRDAANNGTFSKEAGGSIKAFNNYIEGGTFIPYGASKYILKGAETAIGSIDSKADFDAYVITDRNQEMPSAVTSYDGGNKHNNFDLNSSIMYSYAAQEPAAAKASVMKYAGRIDGGDFKWKFSAADDELYDVNQPLKDALMAYKTSLKSVQGEGDLVVETPANSSSSETPVNSSSSEKISSCSSADPSSSSVKDAASSSSESVTTEGAATLTKHGAGSSSQTLAQGSAVEEFYYTVAGATGATVSGLPEGLEGVMIGSDIHIAGTVSPTAKVGEYPFTVTTTGASSNASKTGVITVTAKDDGEKEESEGEDRNENNLDGLVNEISASGKIRYNSVTARLEISAGEVLRVDVLCMDGRRVSATVVHFPAGANVDLSALRPGVYLVRVFVQGKMYQRKILKK